MKQTRKKRKGGKSVKAEGQRTSSKQGPLNQKDTCELTETDRGSMPQPCTALDGMLEQKGEVDTCPIPSLEAISNL